MTNWSATNLGARLGLRPDEVPVPATPTVGWKGLPYFDAPASRRAKPKLVGQFPCVVFETRAPDGGRHAHRIYVAAGGTGKADLGVDGRGRKRDPKKSATVRPGTSSSGRVVIWGDVNVAQRIVVTEGIETAAAVAVVYRRELEHGDCAVVAAISAAGMRSFKAWPAARTVTLAADRDESGAAGDAGYRAGEKAARAWALQHHAEYDIRIALPGEAGEDCDWLDLLLRDGPDAARAAVDEAEPFTASADELEDAQHRAALQAELAEIEREYPLPEMETSRLSYLAARSGRILVHIYAGKDGEGNDCWIPIATPFGVPARLRHANQADAYGLRVTVKGMDGRSRSIEFDRATLPRMGASDIRAQLFAAGLRIEGDGEATVVQALKAADPPDEIIILSRPGWHWLPELSAPVFVSPTGQIIGACSGCRIELAASACLPASAVAGTLEGWRAAVLAAVTAEGTPHWILAVCASFAGPIVQLALFDSCGINLSGLTRLRQNRCAEARRFGMDVAPAGRGSAAVAAHHRKCTGNPRPGQHRHRSGARRNGARRRSGPGANDLLPGQRHRQSSTDREAHTARAVPLEPLRHPQRRVLARGEGPGGRRNLARRHGGALPRRGCDRGQPGGAAGQAGCHGSNRCAPRACRAALRAASDR
jgi:hypothetical protein